jgi:hypothetical protein
MNDALKRFFLYLYTYVCIGVPIILAAAGVLGIKWVNQNPNGKNSTIRTQIVFQGIYMIVFAFILFFFETFSLSRVEMLDLFMKRNFGFLYGPVGKGLFTLMIGVFAFGLEEPNGVGIATGVVVAGWGTLTVCLALLVSVVLVFFLADIFTLTQLANL